MDGMGRMDDIRARAAAFARDWAGRGNEKQQTQQYWLELLGGVLGLPDVNDGRTVQFERPTEEGGFIDVLVPGSKVLIEQKSLGVDLDRPERRGGVMVTPAMQARRYVDGLTADLKADVIVTCNFSTFRIYDLRRSIAMKTPDAEIPLAELPDRIATFIGLFGHGEPRVRIERGLSVEAGRNAARLHDALASRFDRPDDPGEHAELAMLTVRIVFCLYAEDAGLFRPGQFTDYVADSTAERLAGDLYELFRTLDTPPADRRRYLPERLKAFPYVDGGLFERDIDIPPLDDALRHAILDIGDFQWRDISPVIFGSLMEETLSHDERRRGGMHYTSVENIHKVIDPLFLDDIRAELARAEGLPRAGGARTKALDRLHRRIIDLRFLDPACGSGNFLTETFLELRRIENRILVDLKALRDDSVQIGLDLGDEINEVGVTIDHFHGIEINGFACAVARTALWIAEQQSLAATDSVFQGRPRLPFRDTAHIVEANALEYDWNDLLPGAECDYVMGNPPFVGQWLMSDGQKDDMRAVFGRDYDGYLDYATGWHRKASEYLSKPDAAFAFVSTNSVTQGQPVGALFRPLFADGWRIRFAHRTFAWDAQSTDNAAVHVVVIGMDRLTAPKPTLFSYPDIHGAPVAAVADNINGYLLDAPDIFVDKRMRPLSPELAPAGRGSQPTDGGHLILDGRDEYEQAMADPIAAKYVRPFRMGRELINGIDRWCLWLTDAEPRDLRESAFLRTRVAAVKAARLASRKAATRDKAATPWLFDENHQPATDYLAIPAFFSGRRRYATCDRYAPDVIAGNKIYICDDPDGLDFAVIESAMFMAWQKAVGGRLKSDPGFSNTVVWNNLPLPALDAAARARLIAAGRGVLAARAAHPGQSLADLYDPDVMPLDLRAAHRKLDRAADAAFGAPRWLGDDDDTRLKILFDSYARMTARP